MLKNHDKSTSQSAGRSVSCKFKFDRTWKRLYILLQRILLAQIDGTKIQLSGGITWIQTGGKWCYLNSDGIMV